MFVDDHRQRRLLTTVNDKMRFTSIKTSSPNVHNKSMYGVVACCSVYVWKRIVMHYSKAFNYVINGKNYIQSLQPSTQEQLRSFPLQSVRHYATLPSLNTGWTNSLCAYVYINVRNYQIVEYKHSSKQAVHTACSVIFPAALMLTTQIISIISFSLE